MLRPAGLCRERGQSRSLDCFVEALENPYPACERGGQVDRGATSLAAAHRAPESRPFPPPSCDLDVCGARGPRFVGFAPFDLWPPEALTEYLGTTLFRYLHSLADRSVSGSGAAASASRPRAERSKPWRVGGAAHCTLLQSSVADDRFVDPPPALGDPTTAMVRVRSVASD
jgi:hypothetical protein